MGLNSHQYLALEWSLYALCILVVVGRLAVRTWRRIWSFWISEVFLGIAMVFFAILCIGDTYTFSIGMDIFADFYDEGYAKWKYASSILFDMGFYFSRFSLLAFYNELFPVSHNRLRLCLYAVTAYTVCGFLLAGSIDIFWCGIDISTNWSSDESACTLVDSLPPLYVNWSVGIFSEILIFLLPFPLLRSLKKLEKREKTALTCMFLFGALTILVSTARFVLTLQSVFSFEAYLVGSSEIATQIIIVSLPALRPLLTLFRKKRSKTFSQAGTILGQGSESYSHILKKKCDSSIQDSRQSHGGTYISATGSPVTLEHGGNAIQPPWESIELPPYLGSR